MMNPEQRAWVAGILEGEGCFKINTVGHKDANNENYKYPAIECNMGDEDVIRRLHEYAGVGRVQGPYGNPKRPDYTPMWRFAVHKSADALALMREVLPLMGARRSAKINELLTMFG